MEYPVYTYTSTKFIIFGDFAEASNVTFVQPYVKRVNVFIYFTHYITDIVILSADTYVSLVGIYFWYKLERIDY